MKKFTLFILGSLSLIVLSATGFAQNVTLTSSAVAASNVPQGTNNKIVYIVKMDVTSLPVTATNIQFTLSGTHDNNDLNTVNIFFNPTTPSLSGATQIGSTSGLFAAPHAYDAAFNFSGSQTIAAGGSGYFIIAVNVDAAATNGNTIKVNGAANPVTFTYSTAPTVTNNQTDIAGTQTIQAAGVTLTSSAVAASNVSQGTNNKIVYIVKMDVTSLPVTATNIQFTLSGTHDNNDLNTVNIFFNPTTPSLSGATQIGSTSGLFAAPHAYDAAFNFTGSQTIAAGGSGYFIIAVNVDAAATNGNTIKVNGAANPVTFTYSTAPTVTNNQTDIAGTQTIQAAGVTLTSSSVAASNVSQGTNNKIVYIVKMDVTSLPVTATNIQFTLSGTHDNNDLNTVNIFFNPTTPSLSGATQIGSTSGLFAAPHAYDAAFNFTGSQTIAAGGSGYFIIAVNVDAAATNGNTIKVNGAANPVTFTYSTAPTVTNNQTDIAGTQTIQAAGVTLTSSAVASSNISQGTNNNIVYIVKMDVTSLPVTATNIQFTLSGTHDNNDLNTVNIFFNPTTPSLSGATQIGSASATFAAPHAYDAAFNFTGSQTIAAGGSGYFIIAVNVDAAATNGNTIKVNGAANPVTFTYTTGPPVTNNQTDIAGARTIGFVLPLTLISFTGHLVNAQDVQLNWITASEFNTRNFEVEWSSDGQRFSKTAVLPAAGNSFQELHYSYLHKMAIDGNNYYRVKMNDNDGRFTYSPVVKLNIAIKKRQIFVLANPVSNLLQIMVQELANEKIVLNLQDANGKTLASKSFTLTKGSNLINWDLPSMARGIYFLTADGNSTSVIKIFKN